jgi:hypothetical protein
MAIDGRGTAPNAAQTEPAMRERRQREHSGRGEAVNGVAGSKAGAVKAADPGELSLLRFAVRRRLSQRKQDDFFTGYGADVLV